ncbi:class I SAM-dependent methyltransferase [Allomesorhizobium alhagi]|uniref:Methyltransferase domain-containing protein n=1 Tax=Mesorhizobium alhagi CCNWXJ12-2 TaxID=1107882 RepID=H0HYP8_9HYPH|nr:class I SAM-dependent methyltransferase [Mesorhizobium alhagi]EHK54145.1 hypothetical protein MAXJ12_26653 [Mesorhizobium alhagi CCNWXJ12-2]
MADPFDVEFPASLCERSGGAAKAGLEIQLVETAMNDAKNTKQMSLSGILAYWQHPDEINSPETYTKGAIGRSLFLIDCMKKHATQDSRILEIGCNAGRNMAFLHNAGFPRLAGIEINQAAVDHLRQTFPELKKARIIVSSIEEAIKQIPDNAFHVIYTMAVLEHIHWESDWIFGELARVSPKIITIEDEVTESPRHFKRNYKAIFTDLGFKQVDWSRSVPGMTKKFRYRCFARRKRANAQPPLAGQK